VGNIPGSRVNAVSRVDADGNFWLFGGTGVDPFRGYVTFNDLWKFNPLTGEWTWMGGDSYLYCGNPPYDDGPSSCGMPGVYGTLGTPDAKNVPGTRSEATGWIDSAGNFWVFGGLGNGDYWDAFETSDPGWGILNDLWEFSPSTNQWTWMGGSDIPNQAGVDGVLGTPAVGNVPGDRFLAVGWGDSAGNFWLFGGTAYEAGDFGPYKRNDLWKFNPSTDEWTWMGGSASGFPTPLERGGPGVYGTLGTPSVGNLPGSRDSVAGWTDGNGGLWLFAGEGFDSVENRNQPGQLNDFWEFSPTTSEWTWMGGNSTIPTNPVPGVYGTLDVPAAGNFPGGRNSASTWTDTKGNLWLFGGSGYDADGNLGLLNDLWVFQPTVGTLPATTPAFSVAAGIYTAAQTVTISDATTGATIFYTIDGTAPSSASTVYTGPITVSSTETLQAIATARGYATSLVATATYTITPPAATPTFSVATGIYASAQSVTIIDSTHGATIFYTTDGSAPTTLSAEYASSLPVSTTETIQAIAVAPGYSVSAVASATYTIPPDFTVAIDPASLSVQSGKSGTATITVQDNGGFSGNVSFACSGLPAGAGCSFSTLTVPTPTGLTYSTLTLTTTSATAELQREGQPLFPILALAVTLGCFGLRKRRRLLMLVLLAVSVAGLGLLNGCGGGGNSSGGTTTTIQPVTSTITVTATSGPLTHTATFSLTVN
jgi:N-acetylneuraminic acid mutarotase